jgi:anaerobic magnesium-protoporphyrin IX monomethyl ester cyclase
VKLLFTHSYFYRFDEKQWQIKQPYPPYGTLLAAAVLRNAGFEVALYDSGLMEGPGGIKGFLETFNPDCLVIFDDNFNYLSKMCLTVMRDAAFELIHYGKQAGCSILVNSADATDHPEMYLAAGADVVMLGEAEMTLVELMTKGIEQAGLCKGVAIMRHGNLLKTGGRNVFKELDSLPAPAWDLVDLAPYKKIWLDSHGYFSLNIATTRGCPFKCNWCAKPIYGNRYQSRSPLTVVEEMKELMSEFGATHFWVSDDIFGLKPGWVNTFSHLLNSNNLRPKLKIQCRADLLLKEQVIDELVAAGLDEVWIGAESGSQKILDAMEKGTTVPQIYQATNLLKSKGVKVCFFLQYGYLGETKSDIDLTLKMVKELMPHDIGISVSYPLPNTGFYEKVKAQFQEKQNWTDSDDLAMLYKGTFSPDFYRQLHRHTHFVFRHRNSACNLKRVLKAQSLNAATIKSAIKLPYLFFAEKVSRIKLNALQKS